MGQYFHITKVLIMLLMVPLALLVYKEDKWTRWVCWGIFCSGMVLLMPFYLAASTGPVMWILPVGFGVFYIIARSVKKDADRGRW